ncbi:hypothetical protein SAMN02745673_00128 [Marinactinospora thermotolerans DSM 45154]|uniref:Probable membrane transporter protein n=1 Tax=Marinactinospora thermotolerans DSM 45154 TaxID=1122192 RepID=A0A1T4K2Z1_9ACTN|nr:sulfite exporter TauE/SafE family protein [Marinactinospora thermotolerans]SJZ36647.1 hypothetical protein SAMN02745673_00128 [Marinactinospora thermotolerans DSM 45154]
MLTVIALLGAGLLAGLVGSTAGLASLVSYPALLAVGLPPVAANVTNTVALVFSGVGSAAGSLPELTGQSHRVRRYALLAGLGGALGGALVLVSSPDAFARVVPFLVGGAALAVLLRPRVPERGRLNERGVVVALAVFAIGIYGGYFGAAAGVLLLALFLALFNDALARLNALKNVVLLAPNAVAAVAFALFGPVQWAAAAPLAVGFLIGGRIGPAVVRRLPAGPLRIAIGIAGLGLAVKLGWDAWA